MGEERKRELFAYDVAGIWGRHRFTAEVEDFLKENPLGHYVLARWDIDHFKVFNDTFGTEEGDRLLKEIGSVYVKAFNSLNERKPLFFGHWGADHFVALYDSTSLNPEELYRYTNYQLNKLGYNFDFNITYGFYDIQDTSLSVAFMCDRASLALRAVKNQYNLHYEWYNDEMRNKLLEEQEITSSMKRALRRGEFVPYFQPQYNYDSGVLIGAEALVRWINPEKGIIPPGKFIPIFEQNGFITEVDFHIWNSTCAHIRKWLDMGYQVPPISVNISRRDLYVSDLADRLVKLMERYSLKRSMLRLEITESVYMDNPEQLISVVSDLQQHGFFVEMDDFGSGYSSLNTLKDVPVDMLKLDMKFVAKSSNSERGGSILSSVVHMAHRINLPVIAEGVETKQQADYLKTINCLYMQGYLFSKPIPADDFEALLEHYSTEITAEFQFTKAIDNSIDFLDGSTQATLLFNSFVGGAAIIEYENSIVRSLRENDRFLEELRLTREVFEKSSANLHQHLDTASQAAFTEAVEAAIQSNCESECEVHILPSSSRSEQWIHIRLRYLASRFNCHILYISIDNVTMKKLLEKALAKEKMCMDQVLRYAPGGMVEFLVEDNSLTRIYMSSAALEILGYVNSIKPMSNLTSQLRRVHSEDRKKVKDTILDAVANRLGFSTTFRLVLPNGSIRWINLSANPAMLDDELHYFGIYTNVSKHMADSFSGKDAYSGNSLTESANDTILYGAWEEYCRSSDDYVFVKDIYSNYVMISDSFVSLTVCKSKDEIIGKSDFDVFEDQETAARYTKIDMEILSSGKSRVNYVEPSSDAFTGNHRLCQTSKFPIRNSEGEIIGIYGYSRDLSADHIFSEYKLSLESSGKHIFRYSIAGRVFHEIERDDSYVDPICIVGGPELAVQQGSIVESSAATWLNIFNAIDAGERSGSADIQGRDPNGILTWYRVEFNSIFDKLGQPFSAIVSFTNVESLHRQESNRLIEQACVYGSITSLYPSYTATNLTKNRAEALQGYPSGMPGIENCETYDEAVDSISQFCVGKDIKRFKQAFDRNSLIQAFEDGRKMVSIFVDMKFPDGSIHKMECLAIKINDPIGNDILSTGLMREVG